jgi:hypothetical protein
MNTSKTFLVILSLSVMGSSCMFFKSSAPKPAAEKVVKDKAATEKVAKVKPAKPIDMKSMTEMVFGWGGGFTGMIEEYHLLKNGTLKKASEEIKKVDAKQMKLILKAFKKVNFNKTKLNDPGNLYYFMAVKEGDNEQRLIWNDQTQLPPEVKAAYDLLISTTK